MKVKIPLNEEAFKIILRQKRKFIKKFGRKPKPDDPVFFDPNKKTPTPIEGYDEVMEKLFNYIKLK